MVRVVYNANTDKFRLFSNYCNINAGKQQQNSYLGCGWNSCEKNAKGAIYHIVTKKPHCNTPYTDYSTAFALNLGWC